MKLIKFGSYTPPTPTEYKVTIQDIDSSDTGRGETGKMNRERVRSDVFKLELGWTNLKSDDVIAIKEAIKSSSFSVTFFYGGTETASMYAGDRSLNLKSVDDSGNAFWDMSFSLIEM